ncbi:flippase activity-associated protein Agl23 [Haloarchaeobius sp. DFWS5]|uniref:flippase activity-associated protein Agl23 n=1 Tax=Haloarchaeobius sp. DFWS5 TaxID=3446114 RepID=UPI003EBFD53D
MAVDGAAADSREQSSSATDSTDRAASSLPGFGGSRHTLVAVVALTLVGLGARLLWLGQRTAHWGEGRLNYAVLRYAETGVWEYRPVLHGPLIAHANELLFSTLGPSDATARLFVAVVGGLLPLSAWLFREHLRKTEVVALAGLLTASPLLVYYSRFARSDVLVATFMFVTLGCLVRLWDTRKPRYLYAASVTGALGVASKENAVLYVLAWAGAGLLLLDHRLLWRRAAYDPVRDRLAPVPDWLRERVDESVLLFAVLNPLVVFGLAGGISRLEAAIVLAVALLGALWAVPDMGEQYQATATIGALAATGTLFADWSVVLLYTAAWLVAGVFVLGVLLDGTRFDGSVRNWRVPSVLATGLFLVVITLLYAPRGDEGLFAALTTPSLLPGVVDAALFQSWDDATALWYGKAQDQSLLDFGRYFVKRFVLAVPAIAAFGILGALADRYGHDGPRDLVSLASYWGLASLLAYPIVVAVKAPWSLTHVAVPLAIPAAVGVALVWRWVREAVADRQFVTASLAVMVLLFGAGLTAGMAVETSYLHPAGQSNALVQPGQPGSDLHPVADRIEAAAAANQDGPDVLYYGEFFLVENESAGQQLPVTNDGEFQDGAWTVVSENVNWYHRLPLPWYTALADAETTSARNASQFAAAMESNPPVVVTRAIHADSVSKRLGSAYDRYPIDLTVRGTSTVVFVNESVAGPESKR